MMAHPTARAFALVDGDKVLYTQYNAPASEDSTFLGHSMGKTVTSMAIGKALCAGKLKFETKASELIPELSGKALGNASVRDLLRMASGAAESSSPLSGNIWTPDERREYYKGNLNAVDLVSIDRNASAEHGVFSDYKPGEVFRTRTRTP
jgi:CubicO group peptidase (beta-lactamase class C family)